MSSATASWWQYLSGETLTTEQKIERLQRFFADNGEAIYGKPKTERTITLEDAPFMIPARYPTRISGLDIVPMWAGQEIGWSIVDKK
jgi:dihydroorotase